MYRQTTQVPNYIFDTFLSILTGAELKVLLTVIRQTNGWLDKKTGKRKVRDRISSYQFRQKTGLSKRVITTSIQSLLAKKLLLVTSGDGSLLHSPIERKGKTNLFYTANNPMQFLTPTSALNTSEPVQEVYHNKTNSKLTKAKLKGRVTGHIGEIISQRQTYSVFRNN
jgi:hypothetical protein